jgi:single-strand DNA-binding protein
MTLNTVTLAGNLGADAQTHTTLNSSSFVTFSVATKTSWKNLKTGEWTSYIEWHRVVAFGRVASAASQLKKGDRVELRGQLRSREFAKSPDSPKQRITEVRITSLRNLGPAAKRQPVTPAEASA